MTYDDVRDSILTLSLEEMGKLKRELTDMIYHESMRLKETITVHQQACQHTRARESNYAPGLVTWYCPECHLTQRRSHHRERGAQ